MTKERIQGKGLLRRLLPSRREKPNPTQVLAEKVKQARMRREEDHLDIPPYVIDQELVIPAKHKEQDGSTNVLVNTFGTGSEWIATASVYNPDRKKDPIILGKARIVVRDIEEARSVVEKWLKYSSVVWGPDQKPQQLEINEGIRQKYAESVYHIVGVS